MVVRRAIRLGWVLAVAFATLLATALPACPTGKTAMGIKSLATLLSKDGSGFDRNPYDYDILDNAVTAVLTAKPDNAVAVLADGAVPLTAFLPNDWAFKRLAQDVLGGSCGSEQAVFTALAGGLGVETIESVLLYHVVPGVTVTYLQARKANGATLPTALVGSSIRVKVQYRFRVQLVDADRDDRNPYVVRPNLTTGNRQIAHGIDRVLRPVNR